MKELLSLDRIPMMLDLDDTFTEALKGCSYSTGPNSRSIRNLYPPRLQEETWRILGVLSRFLMLDLDETLQELHKDASICLK